LWWVVVGGIGLGQVNVDWNAADTEGEHRVHRGKRKKVRAEEAA